MTITVYHGTDCEFDNIDRKRSENYRDFGIGFYTTTISSQAENWARSKKIRNGSKKAYVYVYEITLSDDLAMKRFDGLTVEWLEMVKLNRKLGGLQHDFDIVMGPVANDNTMVTVNRYIQGVYTAQEAIQRLSYARVNDQISLHTDQALAKIRFVRRYSVE